MTSDIKKLESLAKDLLKLAKDKPEEFQGGNLFSPLKSVFDKVKETISSLSLKQRLTDCIKSVAGTGGDDNSISVDEHMKNLEKLSKILYKHKKKISSNDTITGGFIGEIIEMIAPIAKDLGLKLLPHMKKAVVDCFKGFIGSSEGGKKASGTKKTSPWIEFTKTLKNNGPALIYKGNNYKRENGRLTKL